MHINLFYADSAMDSLLWSAKCGAVYVHMCKMQCNIRGDNCSRSSSGSHSDKFNFNLVFTTTYRFSRTKWCLLNHNVLA